MTMGLLIRRCVCGARLTLMWSDELKSCFWNCTACFPEDLEHEIRVYERRWS
jgi:hypothetical protein